MGVIKMNWRHRVDEALTGESSWYPDGGRVYYGRNKDVKRIINKCRIKYSGFRDMKKISANTFNTSKLYNVNGTTYKVCYNYIPSICGYTSQEKRRQKALKYVQKMHIFNSYWEVPKRFDNSIDYRRSDADGTRVVVWESIRATYGRGD